MTRLRYRIKQILRDARKDQLADSAKIQQQQAVQEAMNSIVTHVEKTWNAFDAAIAVAEDARDMWAKDSTEWNNNQTVIKNLTTYRDRFEQVIRGQATGFNVRGMVSQLSQVLLREPIFNGVADEDGQTTAGE